MLQLQPHAFGIEIRFGFNDHSALDQFLKVLQRQREFLSIVPICLSELSWLLKTFLHYRIGQHVETTAFVVDRTHTDDWQILRVKKLQQTIII